MRLFKNAHYDFMGARKWAFLGSSLLIILGLISLVVRGPKFGVDFAGGTIIQVKFLKGTVDLAKIRKSLGELNLGEITIQQIGAKTDNEVLISMQKTTSSLEGLSEDIKKALAKSFPQQEFEIRRVEMVGPKVGADLRTKGLWAMILALGGILIYAWWRFDFAFAVGGIAALAHDVLITIGAISLTNREFSLTVLAALLTIIGYSINDTIVIYDRVRENLRLKRGGNTLSEILNTSVNECLARTLLTALTTFFVAISLFLFGGQVINDFAFCMVIGVITGCYSTIFIASPIALWVHEKEKARAQAATASASSRMATHGAKTTTSKIAAMDKAQKSAKKG
ncbi:MAG: protein translocase subunit SecF [bacterium]|nr:protein translocase subunit SecF [bacterium]